MVIIPAVDLLDGACVRLVKGDYGRATVYGRDPAETVRGFRDSGAVRVHIVDLDAARGAGNHNRREIRRIREAVPCLLEVGGGVRTEDDVRELLDLGIDRLVVGTVFAKHPETVLEWTARYGKVFIAGIDAADGLVKISGWEHDAGVRDTELASIARAAGACGIIYTNIARDGTLSGPDTAGTALVAESSGLPVILSGGVSSEQDIEEAARDGKSGIVGVITGKALYEGRIDLARVIDRFQKPGERGDEW